VRPSGVTSYSASSSAEPGSGVRSVQSSRASGSSGGAAASSRGRSGPRSWSQNRTGWPSCRIAVTFAVRRAFRRAASSSAVTAPGSVAAVHATVPAVRATTGLPSPPGRVPWSVASPPPAGSRHSAAGGSSPSFSPSGSGRAERKSRSPVGVKAGSLSPGSPRVSRRAGRTPAGSTSHSAPRYRVPSASGVETWVTSRVPSGASTSPAQRGRATKAARSAKGVAVTG
jgi:hypothetical protein